MLYVNEEIVSNLFIFFLMKLFFREKGVGAPLIILHGLWGASENWLPVANLLATQFRVILPDLRNHGRSPHHPAMDYLTLSKDISTFIQDLALPEPPYMVGHSMGGKIVMSLLLQSPSLIKRAIIVDIAPITYSITNKTQHQTLISFMETHDISMYPDRESITQIIRHHFPIVREQQVLLKNIHKTLCGLAWKVNVQAIKQQLHSINGMPSMLAQQTYKQKILFIKGEYSDFIPSATCLTKQFPQASLLQLPDCGHWIHHEQPTLLAKAISEFMLAK